MKILVCFKYVRDDGNITINPDHTLNLDDAAWAISQYDLNAIEAGMQLQKEAADSTVEVLTVAGEALDNSKMRKAVLSRGPGKLYGVKTENCGDLYATAKLLQGAIEKIGSVDLVICGEGSGDMYSQVLGNMLGAMLDLPTFNAVDAISVEDGALVISRSNGASVEKLRVTGKAVVSVTSDICRTHIPSMKDILAAGKKPVEIWGASEFGTVTAPSETVSVLVPERSERLKIVYKETDETGVESFVKAIKKYL